MLEFVCLPWSEVCSARVTSLLLLLLLHRGTDTCPFERSGPSRTESRCEVPMHFTLGWQPGDTASGQRTEQRINRTTVFTVVILRHLEWRWGCCELRLRPRYRLVCNWFPALGGGLPRRTWPGTIQCPSSG